MIRQTSSRRAVTTVEFALLSPVLLLFLVGTVVGGVGVYRYQAVASMAREGARYLSVRGDRYEQVTGNPSATDADVYRDVIGDQSAAFDQDRLTFEIAWLPDRRQNAMVRVKVSYQWIPEAFLGGITLSSTSTVPISY